MTYDNLYETLIKENHPVLKYLKNGIARGEINKVLEANNIDLSDHSKRKFELHNGLIVDDNILVGNLTIFPNAIPLSLEEAINAYLENKKNRYWNETFFPIFLNGAGDWLLLDTITRRVFFYYPGSVDFDTVISIYDNEETMIETNVRCYATGVFYIENNLFQCHWKLFQKIGKSLNPNSDYWNIFKE